MRYFLILPVVCSLIFLSACSSDDSAKKSVKASNLYVTSKDNSYPAAIKAAPGVVSVTTPLPKDFERLPVSAAPASAHAYNKQFAPCYIFVGTSIVSAPYYTPLAQLSKVRKVVKETSSGQYQTSYIGLDSRDLVKTQNFKSQGYASPLQPRNEPFFALSQSPTPSESSPYFSNTKEQIIRPGLQDNVAGESVGLYVMRQVTPQLSAVAAFDATVSAENAPPSACSGTKKEQASQAMTKMVGPMLAGMKFRVVAK